MDFSISISWRRLYPVKQSILKLYVFSYSNLNKFSCPGDEKNFGTLFDPTP